jgi:hypothetical protein
MFLVTLIILNHSIFVTIPLTPVRLGHSYSYPPNFKPSPSILLCILTLTLQSYSYYFGIYSVRMPLLTLTYDDEDAPNFGL